MLGWGFAEDGIDELATEFNHGQVQFAFLKVKDPHSEIFKFVVFNWVSNPTTNGRGSSE